MSFEMKDFSNLNAEAYRQKQETKKKQRIGAVFATVLEVGSMAPAVAADTQKEQSVVSSPSGQEQRSEDQSSGNGEAVLHRSMSKSQIEQVAKQTVLAYETNQDVDWRHGKTDAQLDKEYWETGDWHRGRTDAQIDEEVRRVLQQEEKQDAMQAEREAKIASEQEKQIDHIWGVKNEQRPDLLASGIIDETTRFEIRIVEDLFHLFVGGNEVPISSVDVYRDGGSYLLNTEQGHIFIPHSTVRGHTRPSFEGHSVRLEINNN